jgi:hypothetical protein
MIERWLTAVRDHPDRPPALQRLALYSLALRMDWTTGRGFASARDIGADASASKNTVLRATRWARGEGLLIRTRRGHYITGKTAAASEWQLTQSPTGETLGRSQSPNGSDPRSQSRPPKVSAGGHYQESSTSKSSTSSGARRSRVASSRRAPRSPRTRLEDPRPAGEILRPDCPGCGRSHLAILRKGHRHDCPAPEAVSDRREWAQAKRRERLGRSCMECARATGHDPWCRYAEDQPRPLVPLRRRPATTAFLTAGILAPSGASFPVSFRGLPTDTSASATMTLTQLLASATATMAVMVAMAAMAGEHAQ